MKTRKAEFVRMCGELGSVKEAENCPDIGRHDYFDESDIPKLKPAHTPTPFEMTYTLGGTLVIIRPHKMPGIASDVICRMEEHDGIDPEANAAFIVRAVNSHEELLVALNQLAVRFPIEFKTTPKKCTCLQFEDNDHCRHIYALDAIARAEGK